MQSALIDTPSFVMSGDSMICFNDGGTRSLIFLPGLKRATWKRAIRSLFAIWIRDTLSWMLFQAEAWAFHSMSKPRILSFRKSCATSSLLLSVLQ